MSQLIDPSRVLQLLKNITPGHLPLLYRFDSRRELHEFYFNPIAIATGEVHSSMLNIGSEICPGTCSEASTTSDREEGSSTSRRFSNTFQALDELILKAKNLNMPISFHASYELGSMFENIDIPESSSYEFPLYYSVLFASILRVNLHGSIVEHISKARHFEDIYDQLKLELKNGDLFYTGESVKTEIDILSLSQFSNLNKIKYDESIRQIIENIRCGNVYQVNFAQEFALPYCGDHLKLTSLLLKLHPARYASILYIPHIQEDQSITIASHSPELFIRKHGNLLSMQPIKGTRRRTGILQIDEVMERELRASKKDHAELSMIVDLERNDLGRISQIGSVKISKHATLDAHSNVFHLSTLVESICNPGLSIRDLLSAVFPCGSITGAPKIAAQQFISQLENTKRNIYTGAIGMIQANGDLELSVPIRTGVVTGNMLYFSSGGGIVYESDPENEYEESLVKSSGLYEAWLLAGK